MREVVWVCARQAVTPQTIPKLAGRVDQHGLVHLTVSVIAVERCIAPDVPVTVTV